MAVMDEDDEVAPSSSFLNLKNPSSAWFAVFLPALCYFLATRGYNGTASSPSPTSASTSSGWITLSSSTLGDLVTTKVDIFSARGCYDIQKLFYAGSCDSYVLPLLNTVDPSLSEDNAVSPKVDLQYGLHLVQATGLENIVSIAWRHSTDLGRGYLLLSDSARNGRIWRWEVGGGPIAIGKSLHIDQAGCRSSHYQKCVPLKGSVGITVGEDTDDQAKRAVAGLGSGGIAIDFHTKERATEGQLVVAEWGEGRIVRIEENGARTPLIIQVPNNFCPEDPSTNNITSSPQLESRTQWKRPSEPRALLYTPLGDLLVVDHFYDCNRDAILILRNAVHVEGLPSLHESRRAHEWDGLRMVDKERDNNKDNHDGSYVFAPQLFFPGSNDDSTVQKIGGMALSQNYQSIYLTSRQHGGDVVVMELRLDDDDEDDDDEDVDENDDDDINIDKESIEKDGMEKSDYSTKKSEHSRSHVIYNLSQLFPSLTEPGPLVVTNDGHLIVGINDGIVVINLVPLNVVGKLAVPFPPTSLAIGEDGYLYVASATRLFRIRIKGETRAPKFPTDRVTRHKAIVVRGGDNTVENQL